MALVGTLGIENKTTKIFKIYQGPKHTRYRGYIGPNSSAGYDVNDRKGNTYFQARPQGGGKPHDLTIGTPAETFYLWKIG
jgi:hypothetical protein